MSPSNETRPHPPPRKSPRREEKPSDPGGGMLPNQEPTVIPSPRTPLQTDVDKERADWEGMTPEKPSQIPEK
jgi:hypothetical protein